MPTKNLGQIQALYRGTSAPSNKTMIWFNTLTNIHYYYDFVASVWKPFSSMVSPYPLNKIYYVDNTRTDSLEDGSILNPYESIANALADITENIFIIKLAAGAYTENITLGATKIVNFIGESSKDEDFSTVINGNITSSNFIYLTNLYIEGVITAEYIEFENCTLVIEPTIINTPIFRRCLLTLDADTSFNGIELIDSTITVDNTFKLSLTGDSVIIKDSIIDGQPTAGQYLVNINNCDIKIINSEINPTSVLKSLYVENGSTGFIVGTTFTGNVDLTNCAIYFIPNQSTLTISGSAMTHIKATYIENDSDVDGSNVKEALNNLFSDGFNISDRVNILSDPQSITFPSGKTTINTNYEILYRLYDEVTGATDGASSIFSSKALDGFNVSSPLTGVNVYLFYTIKQL